MPQKRSTTQHNQNLRSASTVGTIAAASALAIYGAVRRDKRGSALAAAAGLLAVNQVFSISSDSIPPATATFRVNATAAQAYQLWRDFANLPRFMAHLDSVRLLEDNRSEWTATGPLGSHVRWIAEVTADDPNQRIAWRSVPGSHFKTSGTVEFRNDPQNRGSFIRAEVHYSHPNSPIGRAFLTALGKNPTFVVKEDLRRFKAILEAGEAPTTRGQSHGPRGIHGNVEKLLFRESSNRVQPQAATAPSVAQAATTAA